MRTTNRDGGFRPARVLAWVAACVAACVGLGGPALAQPTATAPPGPPAGEPNVAPTLPCPTDTLPAGRGQLCVQLVIEDGRAVIGPGAVFVPAGLPAALSQGIVVARLAALLARLSAVCEGDGNSNARCVLPSDAALRECVGAAGQRATWSAYWNTVLGCGEGDLLLLQRMRGLFARLADDSPFVLGSAEDAFDLEAGIVRLQVVALRRDTPLHVLGLRSSAERERELRPALRALEDQPWDAPRIRDAILRRYQPRLAPQVFADAERGRIEIIEAAQVRDIALPAVDGPDAHLRPRQRMQALYLLLDERDFRRWLGGSRTGDSVAFVRDLGRAPGHEPFWIESVVLRQRMALNALGMGLDSVPAETRAAPAPISQTQQLISARVTPPPAAAAASAAPAAPGPSAAAPGSAASAPSAASGVSAPDSATATPEPPAPARKTRFIGIELAYRPGQGVATRGVLRQEQLATRWADFSAGLKVGREEGVRGSAALDVAADYIAFERLHRRLAFNLGAADEATAGRFLGSAVRDERRRGRRAALEWEPFHRRDDQQWLVTLERARQDITTTTSAPAATGERLTLERWSLGAGWRLERSDLLREWTLGLRPTLQWGRTASTGQRYQEQALELNARAQLERGVTLSLAGAVQQASSATPVVEQPSLGGADSVRGFLGDDAIGRSYWKLQSELWWPWPGGGAQGGGTAAGLLAKVRIATFVDVAAVRQPAAGFAAGTRRGAGLGLRLLLDPAVIKLDYGFGHGNSARAPPRGRFYFNLSTDTSI